MSTTWRAELKPLMARLSTLDIASYLTTKDYRNLLLEHNLDVSWSDSMDHIPSGNYPIQIGKENPAYLEAVLGYFFTVHFDALYLDWRVFTIVLSGFVTWKKEPFDLLPINEALAKIKMPRNYIYEITKAKRLGDRRVRGLWSLKQRDAPRKQEPSQNTILGSRVFVVHGHDDAARLKLVNVLNTELGLTAIVVQDQPNETIESILAKIERLANECHAAVVLMTPDDETSDGRKRPRQNVVLELGYFLGRWRSVSERRIIVVRSGEIEEPSDIRGVVYMSYHTDPEELHLKLKRQFQYWGFEVK